jgi:hypothetical protein
MDPNTTPTKPTQLPDAFPQDSHHIQQRFALVDAQAVSIPPKGADRRQSIASK